MSKILKFIILTLLSLPQAVQAAELPAKYTNEAGMTFVLIPPGLHQMRSYYSYYSGDVIVSPWHWVRFNKPFYLQSTEVTQKQWEQVMQSLSDDHAGRTQKGLSIDHTIYLNNYYNRGVGMIFTDMLSPINSGPDYPVHYSQPEYIASFLEQLNTGPLVYRLPTEAEWEYAALAGATQPPSGVELKHYANCWINYDADWERHSKNPREVEFDPTNDADGFDQLAPVGSLLPNAWGLYDMLGNVHEIVMAYKPAVTHPNSEQYLLDDPVPDLAPDNESYRYTKRYHRIKGRHFRGHPEYCNPFIVDDFDKEAHTVYAGFRLWLDAESVRKTLAH